MMGRRIIPDLIYNNQNLSVELEDFIISLTFTDNLSGEADSLSLSIADPKRRWNNQWRPSKGAEIKAALLIPPGWNDELAANRFLGTFEIDELGIAGPPTQVSVKGLSAPESSSIKGEEKSKAWEKVTLKKVAGDIAGANGLTLHFSAEDNPSYDRLDQESQTDAAFLSKLCIDAGLSLKVANRKLIILDEAKLESTASVKTIKRTDQAVKSYNGRDTLVNLYKSCSVKYTDAKKKKTIKYLYTPPNAPATSRILYVNEEVASQAEAIALAKKSLRNANKEGGTFSIILAGFYNVYSGQCITLEDFGAFDGKYIITALTGNVGSGSEMSLELRKCLEGY